MKILDRKFRKNILHFNIVLAILVFSIALYATNGFGWFTTNNQTGASGMMVKANGPDFELVEVHCYPVSAIEDGAYTFVDDVEVDEIPCNDPAEIVYNEYKKAIIMELDCSINAGVTVTLTAETTQDWLSVTDLNAQGTQEVDNYLSNVVSMSMGTVDGTTFTKTGSDYKFISGTPSSTSSNSQSITLNSNLSGTQAIYIVIEYDSTLMQYYCENTDIAYDKVNYANDITFYLNQGGNA